MLPENKVQGISQLVIQVLHTRFLNFPDGSIKNRNAPFHEAFLKAFSDKLDGINIDMPHFISLSSWLHGLNTSIGQTFFEKTAHILSDGEKRQYTSNRLGNLQITQKQKENINNIMTQLSNSVKLPDLIEENSLILDAESLDMVNAIDFSADVFFEDKEEIVAIELKSVKPNSGEMRGEKQKILEGKAAFFQKFPDKKINFYIGFPFDPTDENPLGKNKDRFMGSIINCNKFFDSKEVLLADELWDLLSGTKNTMEEILNIINKISTVNFLCKYNYLNDENNRNTDNYKKHLYDWGIFSEIRLLENKDKIIKKIDSNSRLTRIYNQQIFKDGKYNQDRYNVLEELARD